MNAPQQGYRPVEFDGLVVEGAGGERLVTIPAAVLPQLREATVIRFRRGDSVFNMRVSEFADGRTGGLRITQARDEMAPKVEPPVNGGSAPTPIYGAPALPIHGTQNPSPTTPPEPGEEKDPADIPLRVWRGGRWADIHVTREQYDRYQAEGKISQQPPADRPDAEGTEQ